MVLRAQIDRYEEIIQRRLTPEEDPLRENLVQAVRGMWGSVGLLESRVQVDLEKSSAVHLYLSDERDSLKALRESLSVAQTAMGANVLDSGTLLHMLRLGRIIEEIDRQRPLGPDGKHGDLHTPTCGCEGS